MGPFDGVGRRRWRCGGCLERKVGGSGGMKVGEVDG